MDDDDHSILDTAARDISQHFGYDSSGAYYEAMEDGGDPFAEHRD